MVGWCVDLKGVSARGSSGRVVGGRWAGVVAARRGAAGVVAIVMLAVLALVAGGVVLSGARDQAVLTGSLEGAAANLAADAGAELVMKELMDETDHDGDGAVGSISNDGNAGNDPVINGCRVSAVRTAVNGQIRIEVTALGTSSARRVRLTLSTN